MDEQALKAMIEQALADIERELPAPSHAIGRHEDVRVEMSDGAKLMTRIFFPEGDGPWPAILVRNPYQQVNADLQGFLPLFAKHGYAVVHQQVRGTFDSAGEWLPFEHERADGRDTLRWLAGQTWMNGNIGTYGNSYLGHVQWSVADVVPPQVKAMYVSVFGGEPYGLFYENGMFKLGLWTFWAAMMMEPNRNAALRLPEQREQFFRAARARPHIDIDCGLIGKESPWYRRWVSSPDPGDAYWNAGFWGDIGDVAARTRVPVLFQGGWFDCFLADQLKTFRELPEETRKISRFLIGPWHHANQTGGELAYPNEHAAGHPLMKAALEWFDHHLKGAPCVRRKGVIEAYVIGEGEWQTWEDEIRPAGVRRLYLHAARDGGCGTLTLRPAERESGISYVYDPHDPVPSKGGSLLVNYSDFGRPPECSVAQDEPGTRQDVLTFVSDPLPQPLRIAGAIRVRLRVGSTAEDTAFTAKFMERMPDGRAFNIQDGIMSLAYRGGTDRSLAYTPGQVAEIEWELPPIAWTIQPGSSIRLDVSSSNFPAYHAHPNVAGVWSLCEEARPATQTVYCGGASPSHADIPFRTL